MSERSARKRNPRVVTGMPDVGLTRAEFDRRFRERFYDPAFASVSAELDAVADVAWKNYVEYHKSPRTRRAGRGFADPDFALPVEWLETRRRIHEAERKQRNARS